MEDGWNSNVVEIDSITWAFVAAITVVDYMVPPRTLQSLWRAVFTALLGRRKDLEATPNSSIWFTIRARMGGISVPPRGLAAAVGDAGRTFLNIIKDGNN
jgi:hypothetical protein